MVSADSGIYTGKAKCCRRKKLEEEATYYTIEVQEEQERRRGTEGDRGTGSERETEKVERQRNRLCTKHSQGFWHGVLPSPVRLYLPRHSEVTESELYEGALDIRAHSN